MIKSEYNYRYDIQVKINCEHCDNSFIRHDVLKTSYPETKESLEEMYENSYEGLSEEEMTHCEKCNGYMFETEILKLFETLIAKENDDIEIG